MKYLILILSFSALGFTSPDNEIITGQFGDKLIFEGKKYNISDYLMECYFDKYPEKRPKQQLESSALDRGYVATYEFVDNELFVVDIEIQVRNKKDQKPSTIYISVFDSVFPNLLRKKINWKNGFLNLPSGKLLLPASELYENHKIIEMKRGKIKEVRDYTKDELLLFKERQFDKFKFTRRYKRVVKSFQKNRDPEIGEKQLNLIFQMKVLEYSKKFLTD